METRVAVLAVIVQEGSSVQALNELLHQYGPYIIGRMGVLLPGARREHHQRGARRAERRYLRPVGQVGRLDGITAKTVYAPRRRHQKGSCQMKSLKKFFRPVPDAGACSLARRLRAEARGDHRPGRNTGYARAGGRGPCHRPHRRAQGSHGDGTCQAHERRALPPRTDRSMTSRSPAPPTR